MPSWSPLDFETLLVPVPGENPAGGPIPYAIRETLEEARKEVDPADFAADDPARPADVKRADWAGIARLTQETLTGSSKNLTLAARLTEALVKLNGFAGLRDGLRLLRLLVEQCWDRLNPPLDDEDDLEARAGPFQWLDVPDRGALFPNSLRMVPLVEGEDGGYSWLDWRKSQDGRGRVDREGFEKAVLATPGDRCRATVEDITRCLEELNQLTLALNARMGAAAPGLIGIRTGLDDCRVLAQQILQRKVAAGGAPEATDAPEAPSPEPGPEETRSVGRTPPATRAQVYRQLAEAAAVLQQLEPHSPIPYLLQRAVELGAMPFPELMKALVRNATVLEEMNRELGIKEPPAEEEAEAP